MRKRPLTAMLTVLAALGASLTIAACGGKSSETEEGSTTTSSHSSGSHLQKKETEKPGTY